MTDRQTKAFAGSDLQHGHHNERGGGRGRGSNREIKCRKACTPGKLASGVSTYINSERRRRETRSWCCATAFLPQMLTAGVVHIRIGPSHRPRGALCAPVHLIGRWGVAGRAGTYCETQTTHCKSALCKYWKLKCKANSVCLLLNFFFSKVYLLKSHP